MPFTAAQLNTFYSNTTQGVAPDSATQVLFQAYAQQNANGSLTDAQTIALVSNSAQAKATTDVALATYQFFTGSTPTTGATGGLNFLVNNPGTGFNTTYYNGTTGTATAPAGGNGGFNLENRYYNEAVALATNSTTNTSFISTYGALSINDTIRVAYEQIVGTGSVGSTAAAAAIASIQGSVGYFTQVAQQRAGGVDTGGTAGQNIALKAIIVGYILEEGIKADVGTYAKSIDNFDAALAQGTATSGANLLTAYAPGTAGDTLGGTTTGNSGVTGVTITGVAAGTSVSLSAADPAVRSTVNNDTLTGSVISGASIDLNGGNDVITGSTITGAAAAGGVNGAATVISLGGGNDTIGSAAAPIVFTQGASTTTSGSITIDGGAGTDAAYLSVTGATAITATAGNTNNTVITGVETVQFAARAAATVDATGITGATTIGHIDVTGAVAALTVTNIAAGVTVAVNADAGASTFTYAAAGAAALSLTGNTAGVVTVNAATALNANALTLSHTANAGVVTLVSTTNTVNDTGTTEINIGNLQLTGSASHVVNLSTDSRVALGYLTSAGGAAGTDTITLGAGNDVLNLAFGVQKNASITLGAGSDTVNFAGAAGAAPANQFNFVDSDGGNAPGANVGVTSGAISAFAQVTDFAKGVDHVNFETGAAAGTSYVNTFNNAGYIGASSLTAAATVASGLLAAGQATAFEYQGSTYIYEQGATVGVNNTDTLVQLVGLTGASINGTAGGVNTGDIHFG